MEETKSNNTSCACPNGCNCGNCANCSGDKKCCCRHHHRGGLLPALVILFALNFLLGELGVYSGYVVGIIWPIILIVGAVKVLIIRNWCKCD